MAELLGRGRAVLPGAPPAVWAALLDPRALEAAIPGARLVERTGGGRFTATIAFGVGPVRGAYRAELVLSGLVPPRALDLSGQSEGTFGRGSASAHVELTGLRSGGTGVDWGYRGEVSGPVSMVGRRVLQLASDVFIRRFFARMARDPAVRGGGGGGA